MEKSPLPLNDNLKAACVKCFEEFLDQHFIYSGSSVIFDILSSNNYINLNRKETLAFYEQARKLLTAEEMKKPEKERKLSLLSGDRSLTVIFKAKALALETFFARIDAEGKHLQEILI